MVVQTAKKWIGYLEHLTPDLLGVYRANVGKGGYTVFADTVARYYRWRNFQGLPWCATFVHAVFIEALGKGDAHNLLGKPHPGTRVLARRMRRRGRYRGRGYIPNRGDLVFLTNGDGINHVGIVEYADTEYVYSVEGNTTDPDGTFEAKQGGAVALRLRPHGDPAIVGYAALDLEEL